MKRPTPQVNPEFVSYLVAAGFQCHYLSQLAAEYHLDNIKVTLTKESACFSRYDHKILAPGWVTFAVVNFTMVKLDLFAWSQLMDSLQIVSLKKVISEIPESERLALLAKICETLGVDPGVLS